MLFRSHIVFSLFLYLFYLDLSQASFASKVVFGIFLFLATIFVDIDSRKSKIGNHWFFRPFQWVVSHRGMVHSLLFAFFLSFLLFLVDQTASLGFFVGYLSHLFLDFITREGIFLFWPLYRKKISLFGVKTGRILEEIFFVLVLLVDIWLLFGRFITFV
ncbi:LexA-binding, inner membrane-associated putative hydrolase [uncultured archaeon]|nr:LexA-binding, inner membrane-associated putative hydrolase [uncultured archaeon]